MSKAPKLRFKEFSGDWESKKLGDLGDVTKLAGFEFTNHVEYSDTGEIIALRGLNVKNGKLILDDVKYIDNSDFSKLNRSKLFIDDLLFTYVGTVGETALIDKNDKYYLAPNVSRIRFDLNESNSKFMHYNISRSEYFNKVIQPSIATSSQPALSMENIRKLNINIPSKEEQEKIASFFSLIDDKISLQGEKVEALKDYKRGMMQKIFSRELRFKDDEGRDYPEWEEKKLGDIANLTSSKRVFASDYVDEGIPFYRGKEITELKQNKKPNDILYITQEKYDDIKNNFGIPVKGDLLLTAVGTLGNSYVIKDDNPFYFKDGNLIWFKDIKEDVNFLNFILTSEKGQKKIIDSAIGSTQKALTIVELNKLKYEFPSLKEQRKIAKFLNGLESKVMKEQEKLDFLNEYKKGLLQQMFV